MSTQSAKSPAQENLPKEQEEEPKQNPENTQEQSKEEAKEDTKVAISEPSSSSTERESSPNNSIMIPLKEAVLLLLGNSGVLSASDDEKENTSAQKTNIHSSTSVLTLTPRNLPLKILPSAYPSSSSIPPFDSASPSKRPFNDPGNDEDESQGKDKKKKEEAHGGDTNDGKPKEEDPLEPDLVRLSSDVETDIAILRGIDDYHSQNKVYQVDNSVSLQDFMKNRLKVDVLPRDLEEEIRQLKKKYEKVVTEIVGNLKAMEPQDRQAFDLAHMIWGTESETEFIEKEISILEAEILLLRAFAFYFILKGSHPFDNTEGMDDFLKKWVGINFPAGKFMQMIQGLRRKYEEKKGMMLKNVGILDPRDRVAFNLAKKIWGDMIGN